MRKKLKTTGDLRAFLCKAIVSVESGDMSIERALAMAKVSTQVVESLKAEIQLQKLHNEAQKPSLDIGDLGLGTSSK